MLARVAVAALLLALITGCTGSPAEEDAEPAPTQSSDVHFPTEDEKLEAAVDRLYSSPGGDYEIKLVNGADLEPKATATGRYDLGARTSEGNLTLHAPSGDHDLSVRTVGAASFLRGGALPTTAEGCWLPATELTWPVAFHQLDLRQVQPLRAARAVRIVGENLMIAFPAATAAAMFPDGLVPRRLPDLPGNAEVTVIFTPGDGEISYLLPGGELFDLYARAGVPQRDLLFGGLSLLVTLTPTDQTTAKIAKPTPDQLATRSSTCRAA